MNKKISLGAAIAYMAIVAAVAFSLTMIYSMNLFNVKMTGITEREKMYSSLHEVDLYVRENYYGSINEEALQELSLIHILTLREGRYHQIKRMFGCCGAAVTGLHRLSMGALRLDDTLAPGECRPLSEEEISLLRQQHLPE